MHIVFAVSECAPYAKTGGLADVAAALPRELVRQGHQVTLYLPLYRQVSAQLAARKIAPTVRLDSVTVPFSFYNRFATILDGGKPDGVQIYFVDLPELFNREGIYGDARGDYADNAERFGAFSRAVLEASKQLGVPDVFHVHDWQTSLLTILLRTVYFFDPLLRKVPSLLTIHNAGYQGWFPPNTIEKLLLPWDIFNLNGVELNDTFNCLKGGVVYADAITAVSRRYAEEIKTPEFGAGLDPVLRRRAADLIGIVNGVDYNEWDPANDSHIAAHFTADDMAGKAECRRDLLHAYGLDAIKPETPVLGIVSRFATQKGFDIFAGMADALLSEDVALVVLGTGERLYEEMFRSLQRRYPEKVSVKVTYDNMLAHKIEAGADIFLMPSRYEPCGLNQIYSLKYGTVPVVRATGGLDDTIQQWDPATNTGTGFKFQGTSSYDFLVAARWALVTFQNKQAWSTLQRNGMSQNFSWAGAAKEYESVYAELVRRRS
jgi:starch synthase